MLDRNSTLRQERPIVGEVPRRRTRHRRAGRRSTASAVAVAVATSLGLAACGGGDSSGSTPTLTYYINPDASGASQEAAAACTKESGGKYRLAIAVLPATADGQREQLVRRLAAKDTSVDIMIVDPPYTPELANAGWLRSFSSAERAVLLKDILKAPIESATWKDELIAAPYSANTQLLWYRKSVAQKAGVDPTSPSFTWDQMIDAAIKTGTTVEEQGNKYEGYMVWVNAMVLGAGGTILSNNDRGRDATVSIDSPAGRRAAQIIRKLATSKAANPALSTALEENGANAFNGPNGGFMLNWPFVYARAQTQVETGALAQSVLDDTAWARYPRVEANIPSRPPVGGANLAISKFSKYPDQAVAAVQCLMQPAKQKIRILGLGDPVTNGTVYDDPEVRKKYPFASLMRESINAAGPRPVTPFYGDVSGAIQREWHPPAAVTTATPKKSASLIGDVLHDRRLL